MRKILLRTAVLFAALFIAGLLSSCKKSPYRSQNSTGDEKDWDVFYRKKTSGSNVNELWSIHIDGTNDHKIAIPLPAGWQLADRNMALLSGRLIVLAYNSTSNQNGLFSWDFQSTKTIQLLLTPGTEDMALLGQLNSNPIYMKRNANGQPELWRMKWDGASNEKLDITLPANTSLADEDQATATSASQSFIFLLTRFEDPVSHTITYPIYSYNPNGTGVTLVVAGEAGSAPALLDAQYQNGLLYSKSNSNTAVNELWQVDVDGNNKHQISLSLPAGLHLQTKEMAKLSWVDHSLIYVTTNAATSNNVNGQTALYLANTDGSHPKLIKQFPVGTDVTIQDFEQKIRID